MTADAALRDHKAWIGYLQPEGLVVSPAALVDAQVAIDRGQAATRQLDFLGFVAEIPHGDDKTPAVTDLRRLLCEFLQWPNDLLYGASPERPIPDSLRISLRDFGETLEPTFALKQARPDDEERPWLLLVADLPPATDLDRPVESKLAGWSASPSRRFERLLREAQVPIGLIANGRQLRLIYAPRGENAGTLTFPVSAMKEIAGRPILAAFEMLLSRYRLLAAPSEARLPALLKRSRDYQSRVSTALAQQVLDALYELLRGFQAADDHAHGELLEKVLADDPNQVYGGLLTVLMRLVFLLYAEDQGLMPGGELYVRNYAVHGLFERLRRDAEQFPDTMEHRYGGWAQLLALFRAVHRGCNHALIKMPAREGHLFDPARYPFLEGVGSREWAIGDFSPPSISHSPLPLLADGTIYRALDKLLMLDGERLSYRTLDVEQIGSVYETMMGFRLQCARGVSIALKPAKAHGAPEPVNLEELLAARPADRAKYIAEQTDYKLPAAMASAIKAASSLDDVLAALERRIARGATPQPVGRGKMLLIPTDERRRSGSHYTPRSLTEPIVRTTLKPVLERLGSRERGVGSSDECPLPASNSSYPIPSIHGQHPIVPGSQSLAVGHATGQTVLPADPSLPPSGDVRLGDANTSLGRVDSRQHRRGERTGEHAGIHPLPAHRSGKPEGVGDSPDSLSGGPDYNEPANRAAAGADGGARQDAALVDPLAAEKVGEIGSRESGIGSSNESSSVLPTPDSPLPPTPDQILGLKICDPAMGSGAFLVEACRQLADALVASWAAHGYKPYIPPDEDEVLHARRLIAQRCLYGVDRNPMAVDLAKLSLWLATLAKDHPFTFLDHNLRTGDSLVGLTRKQIVGFDLEPSAQLGFVEAQVRERIDRAAAARRAILEAGDDLPPAAKRQKLDLADEQLDLVRLAGDALVASFFNGDKPRKRKENRNEYFALLDRWLQRADSDARRELGVIVRALRQPTPTRSVSEDGERVASDPRTSHPTPRTPLPPFHWQIEFPEVFARESPGFDCIVGNPPFAGKNTLIAGHRPGYLDWLKAIHDESHGNADLVDHFFRRAFNLLRPDGCFGLIATNTIGQGDTRSTGLRWICTHGGTIYAARKRYKWPGSAAVVVSVVHVCKGQPRPPYLLNGREVPIITAYLFHAGGHEEPSPLESNAGLGFKGPEIGSLGFLLSPTSQLFSELSPLRDPRNPSMQLLKPYLGGEDLNACATTVAPRYIIDCDGLSPDALAQYPRVIDWLRQEVRADFLRRGEIEEDEVCWWNFRRPCDELRNAWRDFAAILCIARVSQTAAFTFIPRGIIANEKIVVFRSDSLSLFAVLQSRTHEVWARFFSATMKDDLQYALTDCLDNFPFPPSHELSGAVERSGREYYEYRAALMVRNNEGLTKTYNRFHDPGETSADIRRLRELHDAMDRAVLDAYGWSDLRPTCEFLLDYEDEADDDEPPARSRTRRKPWRYRWPDDMRDEVLARLLRLNAERAAAERRTGAAAANQKKKASRTKVPRTRDP